MAQDILTKITVLVAEIAIISLLFKIFFFLRCIMAYLQLKYFAQKNKLNFELGEYGFTSLFFHRTSKITGILNQRRFTISYPQSSGRSAIPSRLHIEVSGENPAKGRLNIQNRNLLHKFEKIRPYFKDEWDKKIVVESSPVAFGKHIFASKHLRTKFYRNVNFLNLFFGDNISIKITRNGNTEVCIPASIVNPSRIDEALDTAMEISKLVETYQP